MIAPPPCILFDLDDTILDFSAAGDACWETLCAEYAPRLGDLSPAELLDGLNAVRGWYWSDPERHRLGRLAIQAARREIVRLAFARLGLDPALGHVADELADAFTFRREELVKPFPGAVETLGTLRESEARLALITNGEARFQRAKIERFGLAPYFDPILIESEFGVGKPDPRPFLHALACLGAAPQEAWMVGDDLEYDIRPAQALGMGTVWVDRLGRGLPGECGLTPTRIIRRIAELIEDRERG